jgi:putative transposase
VTEVLCGHSFSASSISAINKSLDAGLRAFAERRLNESYPYLILDARYEKVREAGVIVSQAVLVAVAVDEDGRRQILAVELANRESRSSWRDFLSGLKSRGLAGVEFVVSDNHEGLKAAIREVLPQAAWQRCYVDFLRNALDYVPRKSLPSRRRGSMTIACRSCAGSTTAANSPRCGATSPNGAPNGRPSTLGYAIGSRTTSRRR